MDTIELPLELRLDLERLSTVSDKIRLLDRKGIERADIARILDKRYQHVRNVLERDAGKAAQAQLEHVKSIADAVVPFKMTVAPDGKMAFPRGVLQAMGLGLGGALIARVEDGELRITSHFQALKKAQALVRSFDVGEGSPVDELIRERRAEAERE